MKFLVDSNVLSETTKPQPLQSVVNWLQENDDECVINPIVLGELEYGIFLLPAGRRKKRLVDWFAAGVQLLEVVPIDTQTSSHWARLLSELKRKGRAMSINDSLIAASARQHQLTIVTRNTAHYRYADVKVIDPFDVR